MNDSVIPYNPKTLEPEAQAHWEQQQCFKVTEDLSKEKFYCLTMFPYPSGSLHMGHVRCYTLGDVISRQQKMLGKNVMQPIGWDGFGLPAENAAIQRGVHPATWTYENIAVMREQFKRLGLGYDWKREFATCDKEYYRWEQWFFIKMFEKGLAYKKNAVVNWDPVDNTVLANEQVVDGRGWRSGALVERREISQWFLKITAYAEELLNDLDTLDGWPEQVRTMQRNWIGRSEGTVVHFNVPEHKTRLKVFTTRADTLMGATYLAIATDHLLAKAAAQHNSDIQAFIDGCTGIKMAEAELATMEKKGIDSGITAIHPITGEAVPIWIANYVLMEYGTGAVMAVPAHDERDFAFATQYHLPIKQVIEATDNAPVDLATQAFTAHGRLVNSGEFSGLASVDAKSAISQFLSEHKKGAGKINYRLRDWGISRQRYWGAPIPMILCEHCGPVPVPLDQLPVELPQDVEFTGKGSPLASHPDFMHTTCPKCGEDASRETDTFDTFMESSWYYARFACPTQDNAMLDDRAKYWTPVDFYVGGIEHAVMHLLYARFFHKVMRDFDLLNSDEPFTHLLTQGMVLKDGAKMSKSKGNTVDPNALIDQYGADTVRLFTIFAAPPEQSLEWSDSGVEGSFRFLKRLWSLSETFSELLNDLNNSRHSVIEEIKWAEAASDTRDQRRQAYEILQQAHYDYERLQFNTVVSACMKLLNLMANMTIDIDDNHQCALLYECMSILLRLLAPITPHICHSLWRSLGYGDLIIDAAWPKVKKAALQTDTVEFVIQVNGKLRSKINISAGADDESITQAALGNPEIKRYLENQSLRKTIIVAKRKLVNLVIG